MAVAARYINRELLLVLVSVTAVLLTVTIGGRFISYLQDAALGKFAADSIFSILYFRLPGFLQLLLPFAWSLALLLTLGLPILLLILWGRSLDAELGWTELDEGPW